MQLFNKFCIYFSFFASIFATTAYIYLDTSQFFISETDINFEISKRNVSFRDINGWEKYGPYIPSYMKPIFDNQKFITNPLYDREFPLIKENKEQAEAVKEAFLHGWNSYKKHCWGEDELIVHGPRCSSRLHAGLTIIDSLTTLYLMDLKEDYQRAREFVEKDFRPHGSWSLFEFTIRFVGGFISIYDLTQDKLYLDKAVMCADMIIPLMRDGIFSGGLSIRTGPDGKLTATANSDGWNSLADTSTFQLEFIRLSAITKNPKYAKQAMKTYNRIWSADPNNGLIGNDFTSRGTLQVGAAADSYFEYIIKIYVMTRGVSKRFLDKYLLISRDIKQKLIIHSGKNNFTGLGIRTWNNLDPRQEHLATFAGGMLAVGSVNTNPNAAEDLKLADELATGYYKVYESTETGVGPEFVRFNRNKDRDFYVTDGEYKLRPESVESVYVLWKFTGLPKFRYYAWKMFKAINESARRPNGFAHIRNVNSKYDIDGDGLQESFFFAETLKYLYLTFTDTRIISPAEWVFNTEGHPLKIFTEEEALWIKQYINT